MKGMIAAAVLCILAAAPGKAGVTEVRMEVNGVTCPACVYGLTRGLGRLRGVESCRVVVGNPSQLDLKLKPGTWIDPSEVARMVDEAGYQSLRSTETVSADGVIQRSGPDLFLDLSGFASPHRFRILPPTSGGSTPICQSLLAKVGQEQSIKGFWNPSARGQDSPALRLLNPADNAPRKADNPSG